MKIKDFFVREKRGEDLATLLSLLRGNSASKSGVMVTGDTSLSYSAVWAAMVLISETMSTVPLQVFKRTDKGREVYREHPLYSVLHDRANPMETAQKFREVFTWNMEMRGIGLAEIVRDRSGQVRELYNINPEDMASYSYDDSGKLRFKLYNGKDFGTDKIFYCYGPGQDGLTPRSRLKVARESVGLGLAAQEFGSRFFAQGTHNGGFVQTDKALTDQAFKRLKESMESSYAGLGNAHKLMILEEGLKFTPAGMSNEDAQFLETRKFQIGDIARFFGVKSYMLGDLERATFSNIEQQGIENVTYSWRPRAIRLEQAINQQLLRPSEWDGSYVEHNLNGLMQGDLASQAAVWNQLITSGVLNANEVRAMMNMNNQEDEQGKIYYMPMNMMDKSTVNAEPVVDPVKTEPTATTTEPVPEKTESKSAVLRSAFVEFAPYLTEKRGVDGFRSVSLALIPTFKNLYGERFNVDEYLKIAESQLTFMGKRASSELNLSQELTRMRNAFHYAALQASGIKQVVWRSQSDCPHCQELNGKVVDIGESFTEGQKLRHPPYSAGQNGFKSLCDCDIEGII
jgi:HK97 family phage portal protein